MPTINGPRFTRPSFPTSGTAPALETPASAADATPTSGFDGQTGTATGAPSTGLPRSGWADSTALRASANRARARLAEESAGGENFRTPTERDPLDDLIGRPIVRPMYGVIMPEDPSEDTVKSQLVDRGLKKAFTGMLDDGLLDKSEAELLLKATEDGSGLSRGERKDLNTILDRLRFSIGWNARNVIETHLAEDPGGLFKDRGLRAAFSGALADMKVDAGEVSRLIAAALDGPGLSKTEREDLQLLLRNIAFTDVAATSLRNFLANPDGPAISPIDPPVVALYGVAMPAAPRIKDKGLRAALDKAFEDFFIDEKDADALINAAKDGPGLSKTEKADFKTLLSELGNLWMSPEAKNKIARMIGEPVDVLPDPDPIVRPMYGVIMPDPIDLDPVIRPMYGVIMPEPVEPDPGPVIRPLYGVFEPADPPVVALYGVSMPSDVNVDDG